MVAATDAAARALGVAAGMTVTRARMFAADLVVVDAEPDDDIEGLRRLALCAGARYSPLVAPDPPDGLWLDLTGCAALFTTERALLKDLHRRVAAFGMTVQIAAAETRWKAANLMVDGSPYALPVRRVRAIHDNHARVTYATLTVAQTPILPVDAIYAVWTSTPDKTFVQA